MSTLINSALYVDFDNIYSSISNTKGIEYADYFASNPSFLIEYLAGAGFSIKDGDRKRIFRKKVVYFNPGAFYYFRENLVKSGLRVVDCPTLTSLKKTATDIFLVVDVMKDIQHCDYEDYVIVSSDADFSPLLYHINEQCKNSVLLAVGPTSPSTRSIATTCLPVQDFYDYFFKNMSKTEENQSFHRPVVIHRPDSQKPFGNSVFENIVTDESKTL